MQTSEANQCKNTAQSCNVYHHVLMDIAAGMMDSRVQMMLITVSGLSLYQRHDWKPRPPKFSHSHWQGSQGGSDMFWRSINVPLFANRRSSFTLSTHTMALLCCCVATASIVQVPTGATMVIKSGLSSELGFRDLIQVSRVSSISLKTDNRLTTIHSFWHLIP